MSVEKERLVKKDCDHTSLPATSLESTQELLMPSVGPV